MHFVLKFSMLLVYYWRTHPVYHQNISQENNVNRWPTFSLAISSPNSLDSFDTMLW